MSNNSDLTKAALDLPKEIPGLSSEDSARLLVIVHKLLEGFNCDEDPKVCLEKMKSSINYGVKVSDSINHDSIGNVKENLDHFHKIITGEVIAQDEKAVKEALGATVASIILMLKDVGHDINWTKLAVDIASGNIFGVVNDIEHIDFLKLANDLKTTVAFGEITMSGIARLLEDSGERFSNFFNKEIKPTFKSIGTKLEHNEGFENFMHKLHHVIHHKKAHHDEHNALPEIMQADHSILVIDNSTTHIEIH